MLGVKENKIIKLYHDLEKFPGAFRSIKTFQKMLKSEKNITISYEKLRKILKQDQFYQSSFIKKKPSKFRKVYVDGMNIEAGADLVYMDTKNKKFKYFYIFKDIFSKKIYGFCVNDAKPSTFRRLFGRYFKTKVPFTILRTDFGIEFTNSEKYLAKKGVKLLTKRGTFKVPGAENAVKVIKTLIFKFLRKNDTSISKWYNFLKIAIDSYNNTYNDQIKKTPNQVTKYDDMELRKLMYPWKKMTNFPNFFKEQLTLQKQAVKQKSMGEKNQFNESPDSFRVGDPVFCNFSAIKVAHFWKFKKKYFAQRGTIYRVVRVLTNEKPFMYKLTDLNGKIIRGNFIGNSLAIAPEPINENTIVVETILKRKTVKNVRYGYVKYINYDR
jgi:hypothetical protein